MSAGALKKTTVALSVFASYRHVFQAIQHTIDFFHSIVVCHAQAQRAAVFFESQAFHDAEGVVVAVPGEDALAPQAPGQLARRVTIDIADHSRDAPGELLRAGDAV